MMLREVDLVLSGRSQLPDRTNAVVNGSPANLAAYEVRWFLNDQLFQSGFGLQSVTIPVPEFHQDSMDVRVEIVDAPLLFSEGVMSVPLTDPLAVIVSRDRSEIHRGTNVLEADAYSFNVTDSSLLFYDWTVNGEIPDANEDPRDLTVTVDGDPTSPVDVGLTVSHPDNEGESDGTSLRLFPRTR